MIDFDVLKNQPRLLIEAALIPIQGSRFQPTGFPDLGAAEYTLPSGTEMLLLESAQSMANRLESVCWDAENSAVVACLEGIPYVEVLKGATKLTNSILEAHRLNSPYILETKKNSLNDFGVSLKEHVGYETGMPFEHAKLASAVFRFDPNSIIHGVFLENLAGVLRLQRTLSAFIEAQGVRVASSGGMKADRIAQSKESGTDSSQGTGNIIFARDEYVAERITAFFNLDLMQLRAYRLGDNATQLLVALALFKIRRFLEVGLRLRTACDLTLNSLTVTRPEGFSLPETSELEKALQKLIQAVASEGLFADPAITTVNYKA
jgi:CRISPR-associated protein Csb1